MIYSDLMANIVYLSLVGWFLCANSLSGFPVHVEHSNTNENHTTFFCGIHLDSTGRPERNSDTKVT